MNGPNPPSTAIGSVLAGRYELISHIGRGGMADVYEAFDRQLQRAVAVKVFRGAAASDRARFEVEAVVLASLNHPGLVQVYDAGDQHGDAYVVLELIDGTTASARLASAGPLSSAEVAELGAGVADALAFVHEHGVVHRDVTPANILCGSDGRPRLADFGIARLVDTTRVTAPETAVGTAAYMAPEQVQGHDVTPAADVYALGLVLLELLTGRRGFSGSPQEIAVARLARSPDTSSGVPGAWRALLGAMTDRAAANRPSAAEVGCRLRILHDGLSVPTGAVAAPGHAVTVPSPAIGGTTVMPVALAPDSAPERRGAWRLVVPVVAGVALVVAAAAVRADDGPGTQPDPTTTLSPPGVVAQGPSTTVATTTTVAETPRTKAPAGGKKGSGHRKKHG